MKKMKYCILAVALSLGLVASTVAAPKVMKLGTVSPKERSLTRGLVKFGEVVERESKGAIKVQVFGDGVLGGDRQTIEGLQMGTITGTTASTGPLTPFVAQFGIFDLPFLFKDKATAFKIVDGPIGQELLDKLPAVGIIGLNYWENGYRHLTNSRRAVKTLEDIGGLKIRTLESKIHVDTWRALGANPTPMSFSQLYSALEQKVVDGQENPLGNIVAGKFAEVQKHLTLTGHVYNASPFMLSKKFWDTLTDQEKEIMKIAAKEAQAYQRDLNEQEDQAGEKILKDEGMTISRLNPGEQEKIVAALKPVYDKYAEELGKELVDRLMKAIKESK